MLLPYLLSCEIWAASEEKKKLSRSLQTIDCNIPCQSKISVGHFFYHSNKLLNNGFILCRNKHAFFLSSHSGMLSRKN